jgi:hypothetical protein
MMKQGKHQTLSLLRCVHCLEYVERITDDHLFPKSWYPDTTAKNLEKTTVPACRPCNAAHGKTEARLLKQLGLSFSHNNEATKGLPGKVLRGLDPLQAKNQRDEQHRKAARDHLAKNISIVPVDQIKNYRLLPGVNVDATALSQSHVVLGSVQGSDVKIVARKFVRGLVYLDNETFIDDEHEISMETDDHLGIFSARTANKKRWERRPGILIEYTLFPEECKQSGTFLIKIWNHLTLYAWSTPKTRK